MLWWTCSRKAGRPPARIAPLSVAGAAGLFNKGPHINTSP
nr:MAG TPA: hypothetical protein [Caudoviricetes sp.]